MHKTIKHNACRLCGSDCLEEAFSLGDQYINDFVEKDKIKKGIKAPLDLVMCKKCSLIQLRHTAPQELLYSGEHLFYSAQPVEGCRQVSF